MNKYHTKKRYFPRKQILLGLLVITLSVVGWIGYHQLSSANTPRAEITRVGPCNKLGRHELLPSFCKQPHVYFKTSISPQGASAHKVYTVLLCSKSGDFYDTTTIMWLEEDNMDVRVVDLQAPSNDENIASFVRDYNSLSYEKFPLVPQDFWHFWERPFNVLSPSESVECWPTQDELQHVCRKYVEIIVVDSVGLAKHLED